METATLTRPSGTGPYSFGRLRALPWPLIFLVALSIATFIGFLVYPTYPNYDSYYSMLWGREIVHGIKPSFQAYQSPTEHPLAIAFGALLSLLGRGGDRVMVACTFISFVVLVAGLYRLGKAAFGPVVGLIAAALICSRFDFPFLAARAYIDIPYLAFIIWAAALEAERPRRGMPVLILLACGALMRPEAWLLIGLYFLWIAWPADWPTRVRYAAVTAVGPVSWVALDTIVTGQPLFSLHHTSSLAEDLGRTKGFAEVPHATVHFLENLDKIPVFFAAIAGIFIALLLVPKRIGMPLILLVVGVATFFLVGLGGLSVIDRYLLVPSLMLMIFAAVAIGGWSLLEPGRLQRIWMFGTLAFVVFGVLYTFSHVNFSVFDSQLRFRGDAHRSLVKLMDDPRVVDARKCGPVSTPNHKLVPDTRWVTDLREHQVIARSQADLDPKLKAMIQTGVAVYATNRTALLTQALVTPQDSVADSLPLPGFHRIASAGYYAAYARCPS